MNHISLLVMMVASMTSTRWQGTEIRISAGEKRLWATVRIPLQKDPHTSAARAACGCQFLKVDGTTSALLGTFTKVPGLVRGDRPVYKRDAAPDQFLFYSPKYSRWQVLATLFLCVQTESV